MFRRTPSPADRVAEIYREHSGFVWRLLQIRRIPEKDLPDALHEVFLRVLRQISSYEERGSLRGWLFSITEMYVLQAFRTEGRRRRRLSLFADDVAGRPQGGDLDEWVSRKEATAWVERFMEELSDGERVHFFLRLVEGVPGREVADLLEVNLNTLYGRESVMKERFAVFCRRLDHPGSLRHE